MPGSSHCQALKAANINFGSAEAGQAWEMSDAEQRHQAAELCEKVRRTLKEQSDGWRQRSIFERQWVIRDFKKTAGMSAGEWLDALDSLGKALQGHGKIVKPPL